MTDRHDRRDDDIERLMRLAGKRDAVPAERAARVRDAARTSLDELRDARRQRGRRRAAWAGALAAGVALALVGGWLVGRAPDPSGALAAHTVEVVDGGLRQNGRLVSAGARIAPGATLTTDGDGRAALRLASGHSLRLDQRTTVTLETGSSIALQIGALYVDSDGASDRAALEVRTLSGVVRELGTQFAVRLASDGALAVRLREGAVVVELGADRERVDAGATLTIDADGTLSRGTLPADAIDWEWTSTVAPPLRLADRTAHDVLAAIAREHGRVLAYDDDATARHAAATVLGSSLVPMSPDDALRAVLPASRLRATVSGDRLIVAIEPVD